MLKRRRFLQSLVAASLVPAMTSRSRAGESIGAHLRKDPGELIDLPQGFSYRVISRVGDNMRDGFRVPGLHDGMGAFAGENGRVHVVCNHEIYPSQKDRGPFRNGVADLPGETRDRIYDLGKNETPGTGGTTTTVYNPATGEVEDQYLSLAGTELNCAGGTTPWGSWLSCEECFESPGSKTGGTETLFRERYHGYIFEVPADSGGLVDPKPLTQMGRFEHEAALVHPGNNVAYLTEDRYHSLFYRYLPNVPGDLAAGGRLQALKLKGMPSHMTHNWGSSPDIAIDESFAVEWIDLDNPDPAEDDLRYRGVAAGAATFGRGEGLCLAGNALAFTCTIGGRARLGQVFIYQPSEFEGTDREAENPGQLRLLSEAREDTLLRNADNLTMAPWGDLVVCEDTDGYCRLVGIRPDGELYLIANSAYSSSELAGVCFSPDGDTMFVNIQNPGTTLAINGPWDSLQKPV